jgi:DNA-binding response OmpR family regulator
MIVDDEESIRSTLSEYLTISGYEVKNACDGREALSKLERSKFDCIVSDVLMPGMNGIELLKEIRLKDKEVWVIMITGFPGLNSLLSAVIESADGYLMKPFLLDELLAKIEMGIAYRKKRIGEK